MTRFLSALYWAGGILAFTGFLVGPAVAWFELAPPAAGFLIYGLASFIAVPVALAGIVVTIRGSARSRSVPLLLAVAPAAVLVNGIVKGAGHPPINDISTELVDPPQFEHARTLPENEGRDMMFPKEFADVIRESYPEVQRLALKRPTEEVFADAMNKANELGWKITATRVNASSSVFEAYEVSRLFKFRDDIVVRVTGAEGGSVVDVRSKSRDGKGDLGANAARIKRFLDMVTPPSAKIDAKSEN